MKPGLPVNPEVLPRSLPGDLHPDLSREYVGLGTPVGLKGAHIRPVEVTLIAHKPLSGRKQAREKVVRKIKEGVLRHIVKRLGLKYVDTGVGEGAYRLGGPRLKPPASAGTA